MKKDALVNFTKITGKHLCQSLFFNKVAYPRAQVFSRKFCEISKNTLFTEHLWTIVSNFICGVFFIFSIIKKFRLKKSGSVRKMSTSGKPTLLSRNRAEEKSRNTFHFWEAKKSLTHTVNHSQYKLNKYSGVPWKQQLIKIKLYLQRNSLLCCYHLKRRKRRMIVGFIASKYKKCLYVLYQKQLYIKVKVARRKYCQDIVIKKREFS